MNSGQLYKFSTVVIYDSRVVPTKANFQSVLNYGLKLFTRLTMELLVLGINTEAMLRNDQSIVAVFTKS